MSLMVRPEDVPVGGAVGADDIDASRHPQRQGVRGLDVAPVLVVAADRRSQPSRATASRRSDWRSARPPPCAGAGMPRAPAGRLTGRRTDRAQGGCGFTSVNTAVLLLGPIAFFVLFFLLPRSPC